MLGSSRPAPALCAALSLTTGPTAAAVTTAPTASAAPSPVTVAGRGAAVPFVEAEDASTNGTVIGPDRTYTTLPSEASGRRAVTLRAPGQYVRFTLSRPANAMTVRYSIPDSADGRGLTAPVDVVVDGQKTRDLSLTSRYGWSYGGYPFSDDPGQGKPHHFYDEARTMLGRTLPAGTTVAIQVPAGHSAGSVTVDLADFELVAAPGAAPAGSLDAVTGFGADPTGATDSSAALQRAIDAASAQGRTLYVPRGRLLVTRHLVVDRVTIVGAGQWWTG